MRPKENTTTVHVLNETANRLMNENSPYLLQHAHNPVDWYPWSDEAFKTARKLDKPIFLSIGYSSCHWCHVMERESFMNADTAVIMNKHFINIKVDREERPDIDTIYMNAVQAMTGSGGWPLSVFLTPECKPFYGGTYYPQEDIYGRPGFRSVLLTIADAWENRREQLLESADKINKILATHDKPADEVRLSPAIFDKTKSDLENSYDTIYGGFGVAPKFPQPGNLSFLLRYWHRTDDKQALTMVEKTLDAMAKGGIYDHIGGGFHRYSTDSGWLVPHFEKMLYDQALISKVYLEAYQITKNHKYADIATDIFNYVLRDMADTEGGFYSAEDADSEGKEGVFYVWEPAEIEDVLGAVEAKIFNDYYGVTDNGNFGNGKSILSITKLTGELAEQLGKNQNEVEKILSQGRLKLLTRRAKRPRPNRDDKVITGWNGLMISSLASGGAVLSEPKYINAAEKAADFVLSNLYIDNRLRRYYRNHSVVGLGILDDYTFMIKALLDLYEATFNETWLIKVKELANKMMELFSDENEGCFYLTGFDSENFPRRIQYAYDGVMPSGSSVAALCLLKLGRITTERHFTVRAERLLEAYSRQLSQSPLAFTGMMSAVDFRIGPTSEIVVAGDKNREDTRNMLKLLQSKYLPNTIILFHENSRVDSSIYAIVPYIKQQVAINGRATAYICQNYVCKQPVTDIKVLEKILVSNTEN